MLHRQRPLIVGLLIAVAFAAFSMQHIRFADGTREIFASSHADFARYQEHVRQFPQSDTDVFFVVDSDDTFDRQQLDAIRNFTLDVQLIDGVEIAVSIFSLQEFDEQERAFKTLIAEDLSTYPDLSQPLQAARESSGAVVPLINDNLDEMVIMLSVHDSYSGMEKFRSFVDEVNPIIDQLAQETGLKVQMTGMLPVRHEILETLAEEQALLNVLGGIMGSLVSLLLFRSLTIGALNGVAPTIGFLITLGSFGLFGIELNVISISITVLILVLAMADCIHMTYELRKNASSGLSTEQSIRKMLQDIGPPCLLTSFTTMLAMAGLFYSDSNLIHNFAVAGITGIVIVMVSVLVIHPLVFAISLRYDLVQRALSRNKQPQQTWSGRFAQASEFLIKRKYFVVAIGSIFTLWLATLFIPVQTNHRFSEYLHDDDPMVAALHRVEAISGSSGSLDYVVRPKVAGNLLAPENLRDLATIHESLERKFPANPVISLHSFQRILAASGHNSDISELTEFLEIAPDRTRSELIGHNQDAFKLSFLVTDLASSESKALMSTIEQHLADIQAEQVQIEPANGLVALAANRADDMIGELTISFLIAAFVCPLLLSMWFGEWRYGVAAVLPNVLPILIIGAWLMWSGTHLQITSAIAFSIAFGVAVDDTIHVLNRIHIECKENSDEFVLRNLPDVMRHVAPALITTTLVLSVGLSSTLISQMPSMMFFGTLCIIIFVLALAADLFLLLPIIAMLGLGKRRSTSLRPDMTRC